MHAVSCAGWNPLQEMEELLDRYHRATGRSVVNCADDYLNSDWLPHTDLEETPSTVVVRAELPGVRKRDIVVNISRGMLEISGEKHAELKQAQGNRKHIGECQFGCFRRTLSLPQELEVSAANATYSDGVLIIQIPKLSGSADYEHRIQID